MRPANVGIHALQCYFPKSCVSQSQLETFNHVGIGKYTVGLGLQHMAFCSDLEDIHSITLTAVSKLMNSVEISYDQIGRLEVGTETVIDKSKSVKSVLMQLFEDSGNFDVEGLDTTNACYGGTQALFNSIAWVESSAWDGRYALVVCGDIAVYASGKARPTGGAGAVAMLIGPDAPAVVEPLRASNFEHAYDFYKPDLASEYPTVDGRLTQSCYLRSVDRCYQSLARKYKAKNIKDFSVDTYDYAIFHSPFTKLVRKAFARCLYNDFLVMPHDAHLSPNSNDSVENDLAVKSLEEDIRSRPSESTYFDRDIEKFFMDRSVSKFQKKVKPSLMMAEEIGNTYCASVYFGIASLLSSSTAEDLKGKRCLLFSYGSGLASTMFSIRFNSGDHNLCNLDLPPLLSQREFATPETFEKILQLREDTHSLAPYKPVTDPSCLWPGTYYIDYIDELHRRTYGQVPAL
eukprot:CFRG3079T1